MKTPIWFEKNSPQAETRVQNGVFLQSRWASTNMRIVKEAITFFCCLFGGAVLASIILVVGTTFFFSAIVFHNYQSLEAQGAFLLQANPIVGVIGAAMGAYVFVPNKKRATPSGTNDDA